MEKKLKDVIGTDPENLFNAIKLDFAVLVKYGILFDENLREYYLKKVKKLYSLLIRNCRFSLPIYYKKEIQNIFPEEIETLPNTNEEIVNTIKNVKVEEKTLMISSDEETENL